MPESYAKHLKVDQIETLRRITAELPYYVKEFFRSIESTTQPRTRIAYAYDIKNFFIYLVRVNPYFKKKYNVNDDIDNADLSGITLNDLDRLNVIDFEEYLDELSSYISKDGVQRTNENASKKRKLISLRVFFSYLYKTDKLSQNVTEKLKTPKLHDNTITRMEADEVAEFLDNVEFGSKLSDGQQRFHEKLKIRDIAILTLLLGTGIRVSECIGMNLTDLDLENTRIKVTRKGGNEAVVYFSDEAIPFLKDYLEERKNITPAPGHEDALFLSNQRKRISVRSVEYLVKKYATATTPLKHITPHKLRSTYGTALYQETGDIYLVADVLGHKDVNTTRKHYADMDENKKRAARNEVKLRQD